MEVPASLKEYVESQDKLDKEAREMFPYDFSTCSYDQGYVKQQIYACKTCEPIDGETQHGGVCYSCSISCHGEHDLIELFDRRNFRCDCGTARMGMQDCCIKKERRSINHLNQYNENFDNIFCSCKQLYDPINESGTMYQCLLCEDWFHDRCIAKEDMIPNEADFEHFICSTCVHASSWLRSYQGRPGFSADPSTRDEPAAGQKRQGRTLETDVVKKPRMGSRTPTDQIITPPEQITTKLENHNDVVQCTWADLEPYSGSERNLFLVDGFRDIFCQCEECQTRMSSCQALLREEEVYDPPMDEDDNESTYDAGSRAMENTLQALPRDKAIEGILAFNKLKEHITACLKPLAESGEIITKDHVRQFFEKQ